MDNLESEMEFPKFLYGAKVIIAMKGMPCTGKSEVAELLGNWARCRVLYIDEFLDALSLDQDPDYYYNNMGEAKRLHRLAFDAMCKSAYSRLKFSDCVMIKSQLRDKFELYKLAQVLRIEEDPEDLFAQVSRNDAQVLRGKYGRFIIVECRMKNEVRWRDRLNHKLKKYGDEAQWYKPRSWEDIEKARDEEDDQGSWDDLEVDRLVRVRTQVVRMILDPYDDLNISVYDHSLSGLGLDPDFIGVMRFLVPRHTRAVTSVVQFAELRRHLAETNLNAATSRGRRRSKYVCATNDVPRSCVFKSFTNGSSTDVTCGACQSRIGPGEDIYACYFCILTLHKSCAEKTPERKSPPADPKLQMCKSCIDAGKEPDDSSWMDCHACIFQRFLVDPLMPPIILNHGCHVEHYLSLQLHHDSLPRICRACGEGIDLLGYGCYTCKLYYDFECAFLLQQVVKHKHGGYEHAVSLMYSHHHEDDDDVSGYWCDSCYKDMDPQYWFYSCQACPYYIAHPRCCAPP